MVNSNENFNTTCGATQIQTNTATGVTKLINQEGNRWWQYESTAYDVHLQDNINDC